jgi:hypothetical protein
MTTADQSQGLVDIVGQNMADFTGNDANAGLKYIHYDKTKTFKTY